MATAVAPRIFRNFINGEWVESRSGKAYENRNPANTEELIGMFASSTVEDADAAVDAAKEAYKSWRLVPAPKRAEILFRAAELLVQRKEQFSKDMTREMGKVLTETRGDVQEAIDMTYYMAGEGRRLFGQTTPSELPNKFAMSVRQSIGVCGMITPWNFPMAIPSWKMMPALISGNTVVLKPAEDTPLSAYHLVQVLTEAGVPRGVVNLVSGDGPNAGAPLARHKAVPVISFTGSSSVGRLVAEACAPDFKHCSLEMGGKNILIVMDDEDVLAAHLQAAVLEIGRAGFGDEPAHRTRSGEADDRHGFVSRERRTGIGPVTAHQVHDASRHTRFGQYLYEVIRGKRRIFGGFQHDRISADQGRHHLPRGNGHREIPRRDHPADAVEFPHAHGEFVGQFRRRGLTKEPEAFAGHEIGRA